MKNQSSYVFSIFQDLEFCSVNQTIILQNPGLKLFENIDDFISSTWTNALFGTNAQRNLDSYW